MSELNDSSFRLPKPEEKKLEKLTREQVIEMLKSGQDLENFNLIDLDLAGLELREKSFNGSDIRGLVLYRREDLPDGKIIRTKTNIERSRFIDAVIGSQGESVDFYGVSAAGAEFGCTENLQARRNRQEKFHQDTGQLPKEKDSGGILGFIGDLGDFKKSKWANLDFGGVSGVDASFIEADLTETEITGCDLSGIDFSRTKIDGIKIIDHLSLEGMKINKDQIDSVAAAIQLTDQRAKTFKSRLAELGPRKTLEEYFRIIIVDQALDNS